MISLTAGRFWCWLLMAVDGCRWVIACGMHCIGNPVLRYCRLGELKFGARIKDAYKEREIHGFAAGKVCEGNPFKSLLLGHWAPERSKNLQSLEWSAFRCCLAWKPNQVVVFYLFSTAFVRPWRLWLIGWTICKLVKLGPMDDSNSPRYKSPHKRPSFCTGQRVFSTACFF